VFVTHDLFEAAFLSDAVMLLHHGRIIQQGRFPDLLSKPADPFVSRFVDAQLQRFAVIGQQAMASGAKRP
jgi:osmoprotectant transport system ATP-binding protein